MDNIINKGWGILLMLYGAIIFIWPNPADVIPWTIQSKSSFLWNPVVGVIALLCGAYYAFIRKATSERSSPQKANTETTEAYSDMVVIEFPTIIDPAKRHEIYELPLQEHLKVKGIGTVSGGGTPVGEYIGIGSHIDTSCRDGKVNVVEIHKFVKEMGYPIGTKVQFKDITLQLESSQ